MNPEVTPSPAPELHAGAYPTPRPAGAMPAAEVSAPERFEAPLPPVAVATPEVWSVWEGKTPAAIHQRIKRGQIPPEFILRPTERILLIDVAGYVSWLRAKNRKQLVKKVQDSISFQEDQGRQP
jgi:hypothetical protein